MRGGGKTLDIIVPLPPASPPPWYAGCKKGDMVIGPLTDGKQIKIKGIQIQPEEKPAREKETQQESKLKHRGQKNSKQYNVPGDGKKAVFVTV